MLTKGLHESDSVGAALPGLKLLMTQPDSRIQRVDVDTSASPHLTVAPKPVMQRLQ